MNVNRGAYDAQCERLLKELDASVVLLMVMNGEKGHGISACIQGQLKDAKEIARKIPELLRRMADEIEKKGSFDIHCPDSDKSWADLTKEKNEDDD